MILANSNMILFRPLRSGALLLRCSVLISSRLAAAIPALVECSNSDDDCRHDSQSTNKQDCQQRSQSTKEDYDDDCQQYSQPTSNDDDSSQSDDARKAIFEALRGLFTAGYQSLFEGLFEQTTQGPIWKPWLTVDD